MNDLFMQNSYFYNVDMTRDDNVAMAGNCFEQLVAIVLKNTTDEPINYSTMSLEDISFHVRFDKEDFMIRSALKCNYTGIEKGMWRINRTIIKKNEAEAKTLIEETLREHGYAIVRTVDGHLKFSKYYNDEHKSAEEFDYSKFQENGHVFLIIGEDEDNYYYVDQPSEMNIKNFVSVSGRRDIGVYPKLLFMEAFRIYLGIYTAEFNMDNILNSGNFVKKILNKSIYNYENNISSREAENSSFNVMGGRRAMYKIGKILEQSKLVLKKKVFNPSIFDYCSHTIGEEFLNGLTSIINRREVLRNYCTEIGLNADLIETDMKLWKKIKNMTLYKFNRGDGILRVSDIEYKPVEETEEKLFEWMREQF